MESAAHLIAAIAPLTVLAAISPVLFLNASSVVTIHGLGGGLRFALDNLLVRAVLGTASMGPARGVGGPPRGPRAGVPRR